MKTVRFTRHCSPYNSGEEATFPDSVADQYIAKKVAEPVSAKGLFGNGDKDKKQS